MTTRPTECPVPAGSILIPRNVLRFAIWEAGWSESEWVAAWAQVEGDADEAKEMLVDTRTQPVSLIDAVMLILSIKSFKFNYDTLQISQKRKAQEEII